MPNSLESQRARTRAARLAREAADAILEEDYKTAAQRLGEAQERLAEITDRKGQADAA